MPRRDRVHLYTVSWNEQAMLGYFFRHYDRFVDRYVFYDDGSDDGTRERLDAHPRVEVRRFERTDPHSFRVANSSSAGSRGPGTSATGILPSIIPRMKGTLSGCH